MSMYTYVKVLIEAPNRDLDELITEMKPIFETVKVNRDNHFAIGNIISDRCGDIYNWVESLGECFDNGEDGGIHFVTVNESNEIEEKYYGYPSKHLAIHIQVEDDDDYDIEYEEV